MTLTKEPWKHAVESLSSKSVFQDWCPDVCWWKWVLIQLMSYEGTHLHFNSDFIILMFGFHTLCFLNSAFIFYFSWGTVSQVFGIYLYYFYVCLYDIKLSVHFTHAQLTICPDTLPWNDAQYCIHFGHSSFQILFCCYLLCSWWWKQTPVVCSFIKELSKLRGPLVIFSQQIRISFLLILNADFFGMVQYAFVLTLADCQLSTKPLLVPLHGHDGGEICIEKFMDTYKSKEISY